MSLHSIGRMLIKISVYSTSRQILLFTASKYELKMHSHIPAAYLQVADFLLHLNQTWSGWGLALMGKCPNGVPLDNIGQYKKY